MAKSKKTVKKPSKKLPLVKAELPLKKPGMPMMDESTLPMALAFPFQKGKKRPAKKK